MYIAAPQIDVAVVAEGEAIEDAATHAEVKSYGKSLTYHLGVRKHGVVCKEDRVAVEGHRRQGSAIRELGVWRTILGDGILRDVARDCHERDRQSRGQEQSFQSGVILFHMLHDVMDYSPHLPPAYCRRGGTDMTTGAAPEPEQHI